MNRIERLEDIKFRDLIKFNEYLKMAEDDISVMSYQILRIFYSIDKTDAMKLSPDEFDSLVGSVISVINQDGEFKNILEMNGVKYGFIPKFEEIKAGELIDMDALLVEERYIELMSILFRPIIGDINKSGQYRIEEYKGYDDRFSEIDASVVTGILSFFLKSYQILKQVSLTSLPKETKK